MVNCISLGEFERLWLLGLALNESGNVLNACRARGLKVATAESCTGGLVAGVLTDIAGSSDVFDRGFVTYSNEAIQASTLARTSPSASRPR